MVGYAGEATVQVDQNTGRKMNSGWWPETHREDKDIRWDNNCYACISSSIKTPNPKTGQMRYWRGEASFGHGLALMVDDIGNGSGSKGSFDLKTICDTLQPTVIVETSPNNFQCWYFLDKPCPHLIQFKAFLVSFVRSVLKDGGDNTIKDVSRYGRMPCGYNNKRLADGTFKYNVPAGKNFARGHVAVKVFEADYSKRYSIEQIERAFDFKVVIPDKPVPKNPDEIDHFFTNVNFYWMSIAVKILSAARMGEGSGGEVRENMSGVYRIRCPWGDEHTNGDPYGAYFRGPTPNSEYDFVFGCAHDTHRKGANRKGWTKFIDEIVMPKIIADLGDTDDSDYTIE
jgi:hypothetical protein